MLHEVSLTRPQLPAGRLAHCLSAWRDLTRDSWVLQTIQGYRIEFLTLPPTSEQTPIPNKAPSPLARAAVAELLAKGAVSAVPTDNIRFWSPFFVTPKKDGTQRPILNLKSLNPFVKHIHFKMEGWHTVKQLILQGDFLARVDLKDAYLSVPVHPADRQWLGFCLGHQSFHWNVLPFGLRSAPRVFTKLLKPVVALLRSQGMRVVIFLDDLLLLDQLESRLVRQVQFTVTLLQRLGFVVNFEKSHPVPSQSLTYLGLEIVSIPLELRLPPTKRQFLKQSCQTWLTKSSMTVRQLAKLVGHLNATTLAVPAGPLHLRALQYQQAQSLSSGSFETTVTLSSEARAELRWWIETLQTCPSRPIKEPPVSMSIQSDSSLLGWGAWSRGWQIGHQWTPQERKLHINVLELKAAYLALQALAKDIHSGCILLEMDNTAAVAAVNRKGSARSPNLTRVAKDLWTWCLNQGITVRAQHIPGVLNSRADQASRRSLDSSSWKLSPTVFKKINVLWGPFCTDLFADLSNHQVQHYYSWKPDPHSAAVDAFYQDWTGPGLYAFPPFNLVGRCLSKMISSKGSLVLVAPVWPTQPWYASLLTLSDEEPRLLPHSLSLLQNRSKEPHPLLMGGNLKLAVWKLTSQGRTIIPSQNKPPSSFQPPEDQALGTHTMLAGRNGLAGVLCGRRTPFLRL